MAVAARRDPLDAMNEGRLLKDRATHDLGYRADVLADLATQPVESCLVVLTGPMCIHCRSSTSPATA